MIFVHHSQLQLRRIAHHVVIQVRIQMQELVKHHLGLHHAHLKVLKHLSVRNLLLRIRMHRHLRNLGVGVAIHGLHERVLKGISNIVPVDWILPHVLKHTKLAEALLYRG